jgi:serine/threonine protein kinase
MHAIACGDFTEDGTELTAPLHETDPGSLGGYRLLGRLGEGGMGVVYLGRSQGGRPVAVKTVKPEFAASPEFRARFAREVANARNVNGLFTALVVDADTGGRVPWLATQYIPAPSLADAVARGGPLPAGSLLPLAAGLAEALAAIHAAGVVHRDLKPSNVLLAADGPRVIDFGISQAAEASKLTEPGTVMGSIGYLSPEQALGRPVGPASDVFSLGALLTFAATGAGPFGEGSAQALLYRVVEQPPALDLVPQQLRPVIERCLAKNPGERPTPRDLLAWFGDSPIPANWLPQTIAETLPSYAPSARIPVPSTARPPRPAAQAPAGPRHRKHQRAAAPQPAWSRWLWNGWRGRVVAAAVVLAAGITVATAVSRSTGGGHPTTQGTTGSPSASASAPSQGVSSPAPSSFPCTDTVLSAAAVKSGVLVPPAGVPVDPAPPDLASDTGIDLSATQVRATPGEAVTGTCDYFAAATSGKAVFMQVHLGSGAMGYIWIQYLKYGVQHNCDKNGSLISINMNSFGKPGACLFEPISDAQPQ